MGYTHYWRTSVTTPRNLLAAAHVDIARIVMASRIPLGNGLGEEDPVLGEGEIMFNGRAPDDGHETFSWPPQFEERYPNQAAGETWESAIRTGPYVLSRNLGLDTDGEFAFQFCKTARKPYDAVVVACLLAAKKHLGELIRLSSDGDLEEYLHGAMPGVEECAADLYWRVMGEAPPMPWEETGDD